ncbi:hypothetical protein EV175_001220 [Coemansia sp. RSA 1933]|nr:hypothetical protein EV175_001220 [Coemansia sp. RSA 1933]
MFHKSDFSVGSVNGDNRRTPGGLRRSVSKRLLGKPHNSIVGNSKSIADLRGSAEKQQQQFQQGGYPGQKTSYLLGGGQHGGIEEEAEEEEDSVGASSGCDYLSSNNINGFTGFGQGSSFLASDTGTNSLLDRLQNASGRPQNIDMAGRGDSGSSLGKRSVKRSTNADEQSRYDKVGYPKSTRSMSTKDVSYSGIKNTAGSQSRDTQKSVGSADDISRATQKKKLQSKSHSRLKGFEMRIIDTHNGKAVFHAPILTKPAAGSDREGSKSNDTPALPSPSPAELRTNAQRALINTTSILRTTVKDKGGNTQSSRPDAQRNRNKVPDAAEIAAALRNGAGAKSKSPLVRTASENITTTSSRNSSTSGSGIVGRDGQRKTAAAGRPRMELFLEQGRASTGSTLEQWGIVTSASLMQTKVASARPEQGSLFEHNEGGDSDSAAEDAIQLVEDIARGGTIPIETLLASGPPGPDNRNSSLVISDESRKLIEGLFNGRLSIGATPAEQQRLSRYNISSAPESSNIAPKHQSPHAAGPDMPSSQQNNPSVHDQLNNSKHRLGSGHQEQHTSEHGERDGSKMRKPSFWSIFRGGSQRKEQSDDKR